MNESIANGVVGLICWIVLMITLISIGSTLEDKLDAILKKLEKDEKE